MKNIFTLLLSFTILFITGNTFSQSFDKLTHYTKNGNVKYNSNSSILIDKDIYREDFTHHRIIKTKINARENTYYIVEFLIGGSEIETYTIYKINADNSETQIASFDCEEIVIPGNGNVYIKGGVNELYSLSQKFKLIGDKLEEVEQGAYYIGIKTKTQELITLYTDKNKIKKAAVLPANYNVEILIEDNGWYLIKTPFGLTGWIKTTDVYTGLPYERKPTFKGFFTI